MEIYVEQDVEDNNNVVARENEDNAENIIIIDDNVDNDIVENNMNNNENEDNGAGIPDTGTEGDARVNQDVEERSRKRRRTDSSDCDDNAENSPVKLADAEEKQKDKGPV